MTAPQPFAQSSDVTPSLQDEPTAALLHILLRHTPLPMAILDRELCYLAVNQAWRDRWQWWDDSQLGQCHSTVMPMSPAWQSHCEQVLAGAIATCQVEQIQPSAPSPHEPAQSEMLTWEIAAWHDGNGAISGIVLSLIKVEVVAEIASNSRQSGSKRVEADHPTPRITSQPYSTKTKLISPHLEPARQPGNSPDILGKIHQNIQAENQRLRQKLQLLSSVIDNTNACIFVKDYHDDSGHYILVNQALSNLVQKPIADIIGKTDFDLFSTEVANKHRADDQFVLTQQQPLKVENLFASNQLDVVLLAVKYPLVNEQGEIYGVCGIATDITEQAAIAAQLQQSQEFLQLIIDTVPQAIFWKDTESVYLGCNQNFAQAAGVENAANIIGKTDYDLAWTTEEAELYRTNDRNVMATGVPEYHLLEPQLTSDQRQIWCDTNKVPLYNSQHQLVGVLGTYEDVTERIQADIELRESKQLLQLVFNTLPQRVFWKDQDLNYAGCNRLFATDAGMESVEQVIGKSDADMPWRSQAEQIRSHDLEIMLSGEPQINLEEAQVQFDGSLRWLRISKIPLYDETNQLIGLFGAYEDITTSKQATLTLEARIQQEQLLYRLSNQIRESLDLQQILDTITQEIYNLLQIDRCHFAWYEKSPHTTPNGAAWRVVSEARHEALPSHLGRHPAKQFQSLSMLMLREGTLQIDDVNQFPDTSTRTTLQQLGHRAMLVLPVQGKTGQVGIINCSQTQAPRTWTQAEIDLLEAIVAQLGIALNQADLYAQSRDRAQALEQALQELQQTQSQMLQAEKMSSLGQLVAGVAHEINNPVNFIYGNITHADYYAADLLNLIQLYQTEYPEPTEAIAAEIEAIDLEFLTTDLPKLLTSMKVGADRIKQIVTSLRTFSRMDESERKAVNIHDGIDSTLMILHHRLKAQKQRSEIQVRQELGDLPLIECYAGQLNQVFMNLLSNAIDALEDLLEQQPDHQPEIQIKTRLIKPPPNPNLAESPNLQSSDSPTWVEIIIGDNGIGMPESVRQRIFDPFFTTKPVGKGTGMGLSISYQIITEKHQGHFNCESIPNMGTNFIMQIPTTITD